MSSNLHIVDYILQEMKTHQIPNFIFSSSCTVYGQADELPITENAPVKPAESPYGNTKQIGEEIIEQSCHATHLKAIALRYFNPIGADQSGEGDDQQRMRHGGIPNEPMNVEGEAGGAVTRGS